MLALAVSPLLPEEVAMVDQEEAVVEAVAEAVAEVEAKAEVEAIVHLTPMILASTTHIMNGLHYHPKKRPSQEPIAMIQSPTRETFHQLSNSKMISARKLMNTKLMPMLVQL